MREATSPPRVEACLSQRAMGKPGIHMERSAMVSARKFVARGLSVRRAGALTQADGFDAPLRPSGGRRSELDDDTGAAKRDLAARDRSEGPH